MVLAPGDREVQLENRMRMQMHGAVGVGALLLVVGSLGACQVDRRPPAPAAPVVQVDPPADHPLRAEILRGHAILEATAESLPHHVGNALRCTSCHLDGGTSEVLGWKGAYARYPQYRSRGDAIQTIEDRINDCLERSMNGHRLPADTAPMKAMVAYLAWLSRDVPVSGALAGTGRITAPFDSLRPDTARGAAFFAAECARCHGPNGEGTAVATPLWGPRSFNIGAGMARYRTAAAFILANMPRDRAGSLTRQQALDVAAFIDGHPRPDFAGKEHDWPRGDAPKDTPYRTLSTP